MPIENISDTARWVAYYRAMETDRPDAHFRDPYARKLAGPRGEEFVNTMPRGRSMAWPMVVRTAVFDDIILDAVNVKKVDLVLNLAAGLDARPWRMPLPPSLRWVDVDLPGILDYKLDMLKGETTKCRYEAVRLDLRDQPGRQALFARLGAESKQTLVVTEGLLIYLTAEQVGTLARDLHAQPSFRWWLSDLANQWVLKMMSKNWGKAVALGNAPFQFAPAESTAFFKPFGWKEAVFRSTFEEGQRLNRTMSMAWLWTFMGQFASAKRKEEWRRGSGSIVLERA